MDLTVSVASEADAGDMVEVIHAAFAARPPLDPPSTAVAETPASVAATLRAGAGVLVRVDGRPAGAILVVPVTDRLVSFQRVSVHPDFQGQGIASTMVRAAGQLASQLGFSDVELFARNEFGALIEFWRRRGFTPARPAPYGVVLTAPLPVSILVPTAAAMQRLGARLAELLAAGDLVILSGGLGSGKTTLTQGIGHGLGVPGGIISPTFVLVRSHATGPGRPRLVHVDAYRLTSPAELDDLDLDTTLATSVTVVEWGEGIAEDLATSRLEIDIHRPLGDPDEADSPRTVLLRPVGPRWRDVDLPGLAEPGGPDHG